MQKINFTKGISMQIHGQEVGFVIKRFLPYKQKVSLITQTMGKINLSIRNHDLCHRLWPGMLIGFEPKQWGNSFHIDNHLHILAQFTPQEYDDIRWIHQLFELAYYFVPLSASTDDIYVFLKKCLLLHEHHLSFGKDMHRMHLVATMHFFFLLGYYSEETFFQLHTLCHKFSEDFLIKRNKKEIDYIKNHLASQNEKTYVRMKQWISLQIQQHPTHAALKTR